MKDSQTTHSHKGGGGYDWGRWWVAGRGDRPTVIRRNRNHDEVILESSSGDLFGPWRGSFQVTLNDSLNVIIIIVMLIIVVVH